MAQQQRQSFNSTAPYITPITCPHCAESAYLMRRTPTTDLKAELRTFECKGCSKQTVMTVLD